jgi:hypothetical protein
MSARSGKAVKCEPDFTPFGLFDMKLDVGYVHFRSDTR